MCCWNYYGLISFGYWMELLLDDTIQCQWHYTMSYYLWGTYSLWLSSFHSSLPPPPKLLMLLLLLNECNDWWAILIVLEMIMMTMMIMMTTTTTTTNDMLLERQRNTSTSCSTSSIEKRGSLLLDWRIIHS